HFGLSDQIRRASASIPANIAEGYAMGTTPQFIKFLRIALGSATELATHSSLRRILNWELVTSWMKPYDCVIGRLDCSSAWYSAWDAVSEHPVPRPPSPVPVRS